MLIFNVPFNFLMQTYFLFSMVMYPYNVCMHVIFVISYVRNINARILCLLNYKIKSSVLDRALHSPEGLVTLLSCTASFGVIRFSKRVYLC